MANHSQAWDSTYRTTPPNSERAKFGALRIRDGRYDMYERLRVDHNWGETAGITQSDKEYDGLHKRVSLRWGAAPSPPNTSVTTLYADATGYIRTLAGDSSQGLFGELAMTNAVACAAGVANAGILHVEDANSKAELFYMDEDSNDVQITSAGKINASALSGATLTTITYGATIAIDLASGVRDFKCVITGNVNINTISNKPSGAHSFTVQIKQGGSGGYSTTISASGCVFSYGVTPTPDTTLNYSTIWQFISFDGGTKYAVVLVGTKLDLG